MFSRVDSADGGGGDVLVVFKTPVVGMRKMALESGIEIAIAPVQYPTSPIIPLLSTSRGQHLYAFEASHA